MEFKKKLRTIDLSFQACKKRQSLRTRFLHCHPTEEATDTVPFYENFCFALILFKQKTQEAVLEGKELLSRLLEFQTKRGNFPIFLHDFPKCWDFLLPLKIAPILSLILRDFGSVLGKTFFQQIEGSFQKLLEFAEKERKEKPYKPQWETRYLALLKDQNFEKIQPSFETAEECFEYILSSQVYGKNGAFPIPFSSKLQMFLGKCLKYERGEAYPFSIEWPLLEAKEFPKRLLKDHLQLIYAGVLAPFESSFKEEDQDVYVQKGEVDTSFIWKGKEKNYSFSCLSGSFEGGFLLFPLEDLEEDLFSLRAFFSDFENSTIFVQGKRGTVFHLEDTLTLVTEDKSLNFKFSLISGEGDFIGHISKKNRPSELNNENVYDWHIGIRALRKKGDVVLALQRV